MKVKIHVPTWKVTEFDTEEARAELLEAMGLARQIAFLGQSANNPTLHPKHREAIGRCLGKIAQALSGFPMTQAAKLDALFEALDVGAAVISAEGLPAGVDKAVAWFAGPYPVDAQKLDRRHLANCLAGWLNRGAGSRKFSKWRELSRAIRSTSFKQSATSLGQAWARSKRRAGRSSAIVPASAPANQGTKLAHSKFKTSKK